MTLPPITINNDSKYYPDQVARMMREYAAAVRKAALEEAAKVADERVEAAKKAALDKSRKEMQQFWLDVIPVIVNCAAAIRALKDA